MCTVIQPGTVLAGRYEIMDHIGSGGMAEVYRARCLEDDRDVAVKVLKEEYNEDESFLKRFIAEAQATKGLSHPNIVNVYDAGDDQGYHFIVMELCEGTTLKRYIRRYGRLSIRETVDYSKQIARGIQAAHSKGIVHRDIKPQNILVSDSGKIKVADFGIARAATGDTISPGTMGSVHYLSPEQARGNYADGRSDIYSLGITMYEMATGKLPFDGENPVSIALMHIRGEITPPRCYFPDIPASLEKIILKCTMKRPSDRYQTIEEVLNDLDLVFTNPDGDYVFASPVMDDSPTIHRSRDELNEIRSSIASEDKHSVPAGKEDSQDFREEEADPEEDASPAEEDDQEEEESMQPQMRRLILAITGAGVILLALILIYLLLSGTGIFRPGKGETEETATETEATTTETSQIPMPNLINEKKDAAAALLEQLELKASFQYEEGVSAADDDLVVTRQQYQAGSMLKKGTTVRLTLGNAEEATTENERVEVPPLVNLTETEAETALANAGLAVEKIYAASDTVSSGYVIKQNPTAGTEVDLGFTITITISRGVSQVKVPSLSGLSREAAKEQLNNVGLNLGKVTSDYNGTVGMGEVFSQSISSGTMVDRGTSVDIVISLGDSVSYHYEGEVSVADSPFAEGESGKVEFKVLEDKDLEITTSVFSKQNMTEDDFPLSFTFEWEETDEVIVIMYVNDAEYRRETIELTAVED